MSRYNGQNETFSYGASVKLLGPSTGHCVTPIAFCESEETADFIVKAINAYEANQALIAKLTEALEGLLARDERNTCPHENTHRGGLIWEICDECGAKWADDEGGKPEWTDPPEWIAAREAIALAKAKEGDAS